MSARASTDSTSPSTYTSMDVNPDSLVYTLASLSAPILIKTQLKSLFTNYHFVNLIPYVIFYFILCYIPSTFFAQYGASWFGGCNSWKTQSKNNECLKSDDNYNYNEYSFNISIFYSLTGFISLLFSGYIGRLSDTYGRKIFLLLYCLTKIAAYIPLIFMDNIWYYLYLLPIQGLNGGLNSMPPIMISYIADIVPEEQRIIGFAVIYIFIAIGLLIGSIVGAFSTVYYGFYFNWFIICIVCFLLLIYCLRFQPESLSDKNKKPFSRELYNPFKSIFKLHYHPVVFWIGILQIFISLPESGIINIYIMQQNTSNLDDAIMIRNLYNGVWALGIFLGNVILLPISRYVNEIKILIIAVSILLLSFVTFALLNVSYLQFIGIFLLTVSFIMFPVTNSIVTKYLHASEQGEGIGIVYGLKSITFISAPLIFRLLYHFGHSIGFNSLIFIACILYAIVAMFVIIYPLRNAINQIKNQPKRRYFNSQFVSGSNQRFNVNQSALVT